MKRSTKGPGCNWVVMLVLAAVLFFGLGLMFQIYVAHGLHMPVLAPKHSSTSNSGAPIELNVQIESEVTEKLSPVPVDRSFSDGPKGSKTDMTQHNAKNFRYRDVLSLPPVVKAWRQAKVDWHSIIPKHLSNWERFGDKQGLALLVNKEIQLTNYLTRLEESGLLNKYGHDFGPLTDYAGCNIMADSCVIHDEVACRTNQLCVWDPEMTVCVDFGSPSTALTIDQQKLSASTAGKCENPTHINSQDHSKPCDIYVDQPAVILNVDSESQAMFYHWLASWSTILDVSEGVLGGRRDVHYLLGNMQDPTLYGFLGSITDFCWRRMLVQVNPNVCFCNVHRKSASQSRHKPERTVNQLVNFFGLEDLRPPKDHVKIGLISRHRKRFVLNQYDLIDICNDMGYECVILPLEYMTIYEQMKEFRTLDVLVGMHGSGLDNVIFLHPHSVLLQLMPWKNDHRASFPASTKSAGVVYQEWQVTNRQDTVLHWDLFAQANTEKLMKEGKARIESQGQRHSNERETLMFWINQDIIVPESEWKSIIQKAVAASTAKSRNIDITPRI